MNNYMWLSISFLCIFNFIKLFIKLEFVNQTKSVTWCLSFKVQKYRFTLVVYKLIHWQPEIICGFPRWLHGKEYACQCRRQRFNPWVWKIPWRRATHSSILAWEIPWTDDPGGLQSMESQIVGRVSNYNNRNHLQVFLILMVYFYPPLLLWPSSCCFMVTTNSNIPSESLQMPENNVSCLYIFTTLKSGCSFWSVPS